MPVPTGRRRRPSWRCRSRPARRDRRYHWICILGVREGQRRDCDVVDRELGDPELADPLDRRVIRDGREDPVDRGLIPAAPTALRSVRLVTPMVTPVNIAVSARPVTTRVPPLAASALNGALASAACAGARLTAASRRDANSGAVREGSFIQASVGIDLRCQTAEFYNGP